MKHKKNKYVDILKEVNLRPTRQRVVLVSNIFNSGNRHINAEKLHEEVLFSGEKVSLATVYNTLNNLTNAGLLRQVKVNSNQNYFDTNTSAHHHFFDEEENKLIDIDQEDVEKVNIKKTIPGKKIKSIEVVAKIVSDNYSQK